MERIPDQVQKEVRKYVKAICEKFWRGKTTEKTFRTPFENFIESIDKKYNLTHEASKDVLGTPDFKAFFGNAKIGYIETKDLGKTLDINTTQIKKYLRFENNFILTNYTEFISFRDGEVKDKLVLFDLDSIKKHKIPEPDTKKIEKLLRILEEFFSYKQIIIETEIDLAIQLSKKARWLSDLYLQQLEIDRIVEPLKRSTVSEFFTLFKELIGKDTRDIDCAEAYAETITYGFFLAKLENKENEPVNRYNGYKFIPAQIKIIKRIFKNIMGDELPKAMSWVVDDIIDILNNTHLEKFLERFKFEGEIVRDPFIHFYEDFLESFNPKRRKEMGVYYTPIPVASFITRAVNHIIKKDFKLHGGFADENVTALDPCIGTGTFMALSIIEGIKELKKRGLLGTTKQKIKHHFLKRFYGLEILVSPYIVSHIKITMLFDDEGYKLSEEERIPVYLTNTLDPQQIVHSLSPYLSPLKAEIEEANKIKVGKKIMVITGNPPYSVSSYNKSEWILKKLKDYKKDLNERNIKQLGDDYIKFIRFAQWKIKEHGSGVVGFVTNNKYINSRTHKGMRKALYNFFDKIYILNLHGSSNPPENTPEGKPDTNVFPIKQGVTIGIFVKYKNNKNKKEIFHSDVWGLKEKKFNFLNSHKIETVKWKKIQPTKPLYLFVPYETKNIEEYEKFPSLKDIFKEYVVGVQTHRDALVIDFDKINLFKKIKKFSNPSQKYDLMKELGVKDTGSWNSDIAREKLVKNKVSADKIRKIAYRLFDNRYIYYDESVVERTRRNLMENFDIPNMGLVTSKLLATDEFKHAFVTENISDSCLISLRTKEGSYVFPLFLKKKEKHIQTKLTKKKVIQNQTNFTDSFIELIKENFRLKKFDPQVTFNYIYAVLHNTDYREKFSNFLKYDFPRIPLVKSYSKFKKLSLLGKKLIDLHLMKKKFKKNVSNFNIKGSNLIEFIKYQDKKIYINPKQYFGNVDNEIWNYHIGGYRVLDKWLKTKRAKEEELLSEDINQFLDIVNIINETIKIMKDLKKIKLR